MNKNVGIVYLIMSIFCMVLGYDIYLQHQTQLVTSSYYRSIINHQQDVIDQEVKDRQFVTEHIEDIYKLSVMESVRGYVTMDTLIRVFHYAKPHKGPVYGCPECADIRKKGLPNKQLPGERPKLPRHTDPERTANAVSSPHRHDQGSESNEGG